MFNNLDFKTLSDLFVAVAAGGDFSSGKCVEFALAAHQAFPGSVIQVGSRSYLEFGEEGCTPLSHCVIEINKNHYDAEGWDAIEQWENQWVYYPVKGVTDVEFSWDEYSPSELRDLSIEEGNPPPDESLIESLVLAFNEKLNELQMLLKIAA